MHLDPLILKLVAAAFVLLVVVGAMRRLNQPHVIGYLIAGILMGPEVFGLLSEQSLMARMGEIGVVMLLFFVGMETRPKELVSAWRVTVIGTVLQVAASVGVVAILGWYLEWHTARIVLLGFVVSLSSTAVVLNYLKDRNLLATKLGRDVLGVLLAQDLAIIPMLIVIASFGGEAITGHTMVMQAIGAVLAVGLFCWLAFADKIKLPLGERLRNDHELQVFAAALLCFGLALITGLFQLSTALGAFLAGMLVGAAKETDWVHHRLEPFRVVFMAIFFISVGMLVDLAFFIEHWSRILLMLAAVLLVNTLINAAIFKSLGDCWRTSLLAGAILAQVGEFSFVLAAVGKSAGAISDFGYQLTISVIALSLLSSPLWIALFNRKNADEPELIPDSPLPAERH
jgi:CPA2 family monovalent cation:H+ antiporter-2